MPLIDAYYTVLYMKVNRFVLEAVLPDFKKAYRGMKPVEDSQRHGDMCDDSPRPWAVEC